MERKLRLGFYALDLLIVAGLILSMSHAMFFSSELAWIGSIVVILLRVALPFLMYRKVKWRVWAVVAFAAYFGYMIFSGAFHDLILHMGKCPGILLHKEGFLQGNNLIFGNLSNGEFLFWFVLVWTWLAPIVAYLVQLSQRYSVSIKIRKSTHDDS